MSKKSFFAAVLLGIFSFLFLCSPASASQAELVSVQFGIKEAGAKWKAGETSISKLPEVERLRRVGGFKIPSDMTAKSLSIAAPLARTGAGADIDFRNFNGMNYVTPVKNQGGCGSCWDFASTAAAESYFLLNNPALDANSFSLSEQYLLSCGNSGTCNGGGMNSASDFIESNGLPLAACFPYTATDEACSDSQCQNSQMYKIPTYRMVTNTSYTASDIENALAVYGPLTTSMNVYSDFYYYKEGVYSITPGSTFEGVHGILIIAHESAKKCFVCKNSWNTYWGENGFFEIADDQITSVVTFGEGTIAYGYGIGNGAVSAIISPASAVSAGAQWSIDNGTTWNKSGDVVSEPSGKTYTVTYKSVSGFTTPVSRSITVTLGQLATATEVYTQVQGTLAVAISPSNIGGTFQVDGGSWQAPGTISIVPGTHAIAFSAVAGYLTPGSQTVNIGSGTKTSITGTYAPAPVNGICGSAAKMYAYGATGFSGLLCSIGSANPINPSFPGAGLSASWQCVGSNGGSTSTCSAGQAAPPPINGACGPAATVHPYGSSSFSSALCDTGVANPASPVFPGPGSKVTWQCVGSNGGSTSNCIASQATPPLPTLTVSASASKIYKNGTARIVITASASNGGNNVKISLATNGTAIKGHDYTLKGQAILKHGTAVTQFTVVPQKNVPFATDKTVAFTIGAVPGYTLAKNAVTVIILADPAVTVEASIPTASRSKKTPGQFTFTRKSVDGQSLDVSRPLTVTLVHSRSSAYKTLPGKVIIPANAASVTVSVVPCPLPKKGTVAAVNATVTLKPSNAYSIGANGSATVVVSP
ncbi:MAG: C1 family peptidase [Candidatus Pacebacteria bacterium]|nr:C1 family peptidase [Candidatus Paceibacterota bacterium]